MMVGMVRLLPGGREDKRLNSRPPRPERGALTWLRYISIKQKNKELYLLEREALMPKKHKK